MGIQIDGSDLSMMGVGVDVPYGSSDSYTYEVEEDYHYMNGDADRNEAVNILDVTYLIAYLYKGGPEPYPVFAGDADCNLAVNILDITYLISYLYKGGEPPCDMGL
jgi:hypothetical protein